MLNKVMLIGNLGDNPDVRYMPSGDAITNIRLATTTKWKDKQSGEKKEKTEWHRIVFFRKLAEVAGEYLKKGSKVYIEGRIQTRKWQDQSGQDRWSTEIIAEQMQMLGGRNEEPNKQSADQIQQQNSVDSNNTPPEHFDDDIPF